MHKLNYDGINEFVTTNVMRPFYEKRLAKLEELGLSYILKRKNPYLFKAKNIETSGDFIKYVLDAYLSSQEETMFGNLMEDLAIYICSQVYGGKKAEQGTYKSIDLIFERDNKVYLVSIKSGIYWGNKDQIDRMKSNFKTARSLLEAVYPEKEIVCVNGCMYGKDRHPYKIDRHDSEKNYYKICGQEFWFLISNDKELYKALIMPLEREAKKRDDQFKEVYSSKANSMTKEFSDNFLDERGLIDWAKIIEFVSKKE
jgi:hypothetical protein